MKGNNKILVTGATGFVGRALIARLLNEHYLVNCALRRKTNSDDLKGCSNFILGDFSTTTDWRESLENVDTVIHLAARVHVMHETDSNPLQRFREANVDTTLNLAQSAVQAGVRRFIYISTVKVHGERTQKFPFTETDPLVPSDPYAQSKLEAEQGLQNIAKDSGLEVVIIRPVLVYGKEVKGNFIRLLSLVNKGIPMPFASMSNRRSMIGLENLVDLIVHCIEHPAASGEAFLAADGMDISTEELIKLLARFSNRKVRLFKMPQMLLTIFASLPRVNKFIDRLYGSLQVDITKARDVLQWNPPKSVEQGIKNTVSWYGNLNR